MHTYLDLGQDTLRDIEDCEGGLDSQLGLANGDDMDVCCAMPSLPLGSKMATGGDAAEDAPASDSREVPGSQAEGLQPPGHPDPEKSPSPKLEAPKSAKSLLKAHRPENFEKPEADNPKKSQNPVAHNPKKSQDPMAHNPEKSQAHNPEKSQDPMAHNPEKSQAHNPEKSQDPMAHNPEKSQAHNPEKSQANNPEKSQDPMAHNPEKSQEPKVHQFGPSGTDMSQATQQSTASLMPSAMSHAKFNRAWIAIAIDRYFV